MPKRSDWSSDLLTIGLFAPMVMASRLQTLVLEGGRPSARGRREAFRMSAEKPLAAMEGVVAVQKQLFDGSLRFWSDMALATNAFLMTGPLMSAAVTAPVRRRVRGNARRLTGY
jgi:hypothetical protein